MTFPDFLTGLELEQRLPGRPLRPRRTGDVGR
jgi:hypothetical protein